MRLLLKDGVSRCVRCGGSKERPLFEELGRLLLKDVVSRCVRCGGSKERPLFEELGRLLLKDGGACREGCGRATAGSPPPRGRGGRFVCVKHAGVFVGRWAWALGACQS